MYIYIYMYIYTYIYMYIYIYREREIYHGACVRRPATTRRMLLTTICNIASKSICLNYL